jgi:hypothetical protein
LLESVSFKRTLRSVPTGILTTVALVVVVVVFRTTLRRGLRRRVVVVVVVVFVCAFKAGAPDCASPGSAPAATIAIVNNAN